jgi:hypothetical protein
LIDSGNKDPEVKSTISGQEAAEPAGDSAQQNIIEPEFIEEAAGP